MTIVSLNLNALAAPIVTGLGVCVVEALELTPAGAPTRQCLLVPSSQITHDNCDCGGQVALAIQQVYGSDSFPTPGPINNWQKCGPHYDVVQGIVSVTRCVPGMTEQAAGVWSPPDCADLLEAAIQIDYDRVAVRQALTCCLSALAAPAIPAIAAWQLGPTNYLNEEGQCSGTETTFLFGLRRCGCPGL